MPKSPSFRYTITSATDCRLVDDAIQHMHCAKETSVQWFDSREEANNKSLNETEFLEKISQIKRLINPDVVTQPARTQLGDPPPFILITTKGDHVHEEQPLQISSPVLKAIIHAGIFPPHFLTVYQETQSHFSHKMQYDESSNLPIAIYIFLRIPRVGRIMNLTIRISLQNLTTIALLSSRIASSVASIRSRCIRQTSLLHTHPLHLLNIVFESRMGDFEDWIDGLWGYVISLERKTGIGTHWSADGRETRGRPLGHEEYEKLLRDLHGSTVELRLALGTMRFAVDLGTGFKMVAQRIEESRRDIGIEDIKRGTKVAWEDQVDFNATIVRTTLTKVNELVDRVQAQINVTYSLITQRSSEQNIQIAKIMARDSQTMKTITVLTLTFLPSTMLASLWDAGIFTLDPDKSWRVYLGSASALTIAVFALWFLYLWVTRTRVAAVVSRDEEAKEGKRKVTV